MASRLVVSCCLGGLLMFVGCAAGGGGGVNGNQKQVCNIGLSIFPQTGSADHSAQEPGNQMKFVTWYGPLPGSTCLTPVRMIQNANWTSSDPLDVQVDNTVGDSNGTATCTHSTSQPATLTATYTPPGASVETATAQMSCK